MCGPPASGASGTLRVGLNEQSYGLPGDRRAWRFGAPICLLKLSPAFRGRIVPVAQSLGFHIKPARDLLQDKVLRCSPFLRQCLCRVRRATAAPPSGLDLSPKVSEGYPGEDVGEGHRLLGPAAPPSNLSFDPVSDDLSYDPGNQPAILPSRGVRSRFPGWHFSFSSRLFG